MFSINQIPLPIQLYMPLLTACLLGAASIALVLMLLRDRQAGESLRRKSLARRLRGLQMKRMIGVRGINFDLYVQLTSIALLRKELDACHRCLIKPRCDTSYIAGVESDISLSYCPNTPSLDQAWGTLRRR